AGPIRVGPAGAVAVQVLELAAGARQPLGDVRVQRGVGAVVDGFGDRLAIQQVGDRLAHGPSLVRIRVRGLLAVGVGAEVEHDVADLAARAVVHGDGIVLLEVGDVRGGQRAPDAVDVALLDGGLQVGLV